MQHSTSSRARHIEGALRKAFAAADASLASIPDSTIRKGGSLGSLIISAAHNSAVDPREQAFQIGKRLESDVEAALSLLDAASAEGKALEAVAAHLETGARLPDDIDTALAAHAKQVRAGHLAGLLDGVAIAADIRRSIEQASNEVKRLQNTLAASSRSAARVVGAKAVQTAYTRAGLVKSAETAALRVTRLQALHRAKFEFSDRARPRTAKRFDKETAR